MNRDGMLLLSGVTVPVITPMAADGHVDPDGAYALFAALAGAGVRKLLLLGSNGEGPLVPDADLTASLGFLVRAWRDAAGQGSVVTVNVTAPGTLQARGRADVAAEAGADAVVLSPPLYFRHSDREIVSHYAAFDRFGLPVIVYNTPRYANPLNIETAREVLGMPHVAGVKDSSADPAVLRQLVDIAAQNPGVAVSQGAETRLVEGLAAGAHGIVPGVGNVAPALCLELHSSWQAGDRDAADAAQRVVTDLTKMHEIHRGVATVKQLLAIAGLATPYVTPPLLPCDEGERDELRRFAGRFEGILLRGVA